MIGDSALPEILSDKPNKLRKHWVDDRIKRLRGLNVSDRNLNVSRLISDLNNHINDNVIEVESDCFESSDFLQLSFDFI